MALVQHCYQPKRKPSQHQNVQISALKVGIDKTPTPLMILGRGTQTLGPNPDLLKATEDFSHIVNNPAQTTVCSLNLRDFCCSVVKDENNSLSLENLADFQSFSQHSFVKRSVGSVRCLRDLNLFLLQPSRNTLADIRKLIFKSTNQRHSSCTR